MPSDQNAYQDHEQQKAVEKNLSRLAKASRLDRETLIREAIHFAASREKEFILFTTSRTITPSWRSHILRRLSLLQDMGATVFVFVMFIIGMILSIAVMLSRK